MDCRYQIWIADIKTKVIKVENTNLRMVIDTSSSANIIDKNQFEKFKERKPR